MTFGEDARKKLADGINAVADAVKVGRCACKTSEYSPLPVCAFGEDWTSSRKKWLFLDDFSIRSGA